MLKLRRQAKYAGAYSLDKTNSLTNGMVFCVTYGEGGGTPYNLVTGGRGTLTGTLSYIPGMLGSNARNSVTLGGTNSEAFSSLLIANGSTVTYDAWVYIRTFAGGGIPISGIISDANQVHLRFGDVGLAGTKLEFVVQGAIAAKGATALSTNRLYHIAGTADGTSLQVYVNGIVDGTNVNSGVVGADITSMNLFKDDSGGRGPDGWIEMARAWNRALSPAEIQELYLNPFGMFASRKIRFNRLVPVSTPKSPNFTTLGVG